MNVKGVGGHVVYCYVLLVYEFFNLDYIFLDVGGDQSWK